MPENVIFIAGFLFDQCNLASLIDTSIIYELTFHLNYPSSFIAILQVHIHPIVTTMNSSRKMPTRITAVDVRIVSVFISLVWFSEQQLHVYPFQVRKKDRLVCE